MPNWERNLPPMAKPERDKRPKAIQNLEALAINKTNFAKLGIIRCESCGTQFALTFAHRKKRRFYYNLEQLTDIAEVILLCQPEHELAEKSPKLTKQLFVKLRTPEITTKLKLILHENT